MASNARQLALLYNVLLIAFGLCVSLYLTRIHRAPLPRDEIAALANFTRDSLRKAWPLASIEVSAVGLEHEDLSVFAQALSIALAGSDAEVSRAEAPPAELSKLAPCTADQDSADACLQALDAIAFQATSHGELGSRFELMLVPAASCSTLILGTGQSAVLRWQKGQAPLSTAKELAKAAADHLKASWLRPASFDSKTDLFEITPAYVMSFFLVGDCRERVSWSFPETVLAPYLRRFLEKLQTLFDLELDSQVVQCGSLGNSLEPDALERHRKQGGLIDASMLQADFMRRTGDWPKDALTRDARWMAPLVRLVAFKPSESMKLVDAEGRQQTSFAVQSFGAVAVAQCDRETGANSSRLGAMTDCEAQRVTSSWVSSLRSWLSLPSDEPLGESAIDCLAGGLGLMAASPRLDGLTDWELRILARGVQALFLQRTAEVLHNLVELVDSLPEIVVREEIGQMAFQAIAKARGSAALAIAGKLPDALAQSREALILALTVSHDDSVMAQLYFSWEFKYAVYLPIGLPLAVPVLAALGRELKAGFAALRKRRTLVAS